MHEYPIQSLRLRGSFRRGLTLVELVVAFALLVAGVVPVLRALTQAHAIMRRVETTSRSVALAQGTLNRVRAQVAGDYGRAFTTESQDLGDRYLATVSDDRDDELRRITVSVGFDEDGDARLSPPEQRVTLTTAIAFTGSDPL